MSNSAAENRRQKTWLALAIGALNALGIFLLLGIVVPQHLALQTGGVFGIGLGLTAYALGMRHAFDADHVAAIDSVTRKLMNEDKQTLSVGFFFSLGHSTIVVALGALIAVGVNGIAGAIENQDSALNVITGTWGPLVAGVFLLLIGVMNLIVLANIGRGIKRLRRGELDESELERQLEARGGMARFYTRASRSISAPWQMYPLGMMFGLGFDTASEIALLLLAGGAAASGLPFYAVMCLPILFAAGMTLFDTLNSVLMNKAYGWALDQPARKAAYNFTVTGVTAISALLIGAVSLFGVAIERLHLTGAFWDSVAAIDMQFAGFTLVALFFALWLAALATWKRSERQK